MKIQRVIFLSSFNQTFWHISLRIQIVETCVALLRFYAQLFAESDRVYIII